MINVKDDVLKALESNQELISLLGGDNIYQLVSPDSTTYPRIIFFEISNVDSNYVDDDATTSRISIQIDIYAKASTTAIAEQVDSTMKSIGFYRTSSHDLYDNDVKVFRKVLRYKTIKLI